MFHKDYLIRQIELMTESIGCLVFNKEASEKNEIHSEISQAESDLLHVLLCDLIAKERVNEAENLLFDSLDPDNQNHLVIAIDFYRRLNDMTDEELDNADFSREEVENGLAEVKSIFDLEVLRAT
ncbi:MAG: DUF6483 family protein [Oscillospiraceae bacterium]|nr:DUF6483 family protein [Oscillospiraceae bacterium]